MICQLHSPIGHGFSHTASHPAYIHWHTTRISHTWGCRHCHIYSKKYSFTGVNIKRHLNPYIRENQIGEIFFCAKQIFFIKPLWMTLLQTLPWKARKWFLPKFICASSKPWRCIPSQTVLPGWFCLNVLPYLLITQFKHLFHFFLFLSSSNKVIFKFYMFSFLLYGYIRPLLQAYTIFRAYPCIAHYPPSS